MLPYESVAGSSVVEVTVTVGVCGDDIVGSSEDCDGSNLNGGTCRTEGFVSGTLACTIACDYDTSGCAPPSNPGRSGSSGSSNSSSNSSSGSSNGNKGRNAAVTVPDNRSRRSRTVTVPVEDFTQLLIELPSVVTTDDVSISQPETSDINENIEQTEQQLQPPGEEEGFVERRLLPIIKEVSEGFTNVASTVNNFDLVDRVQSLVYSVREITENSIRYLGNIVVTLFISLWNFFVR